MADARTQPRRRLALVVSTAPERGDLERASALAHAALDAGVEVGIFFMDAAVRALPHERGRLEALADKGCELVACASSLHQHGVDAASTGVVVAGSQDDHAALAHRADRLVAFT